MLIAHCSECSRLDQYINSDHDYAPIDFLINPSENGLDGIQDKVKD